MTGSAQRLRPQDAPDGSHPVKRRVPVGIAVLLGGLLTGPPIVGTQSPDAMIAMATAALDDAVRDGAMVAGEFDNGHRRVLRWETNGWLCRLSLAPSLVAHCYEGETSQPFMATVDATV